MAVIVVHCVSIDLLMHSVMFQTFSYYFIAGMIWSYSFRVISIMTNRKSVTGQTVYQLVLTKRNFKLIE